MISVEARVRRAKAYMATMDPAVSGQDGHDQTFAVTCVPVRDFALSVDEARPLLAEYNLGCRPPWEPHELEHKLVDADKFDGLRGSKLIPYFGNYVVCEGTKTVTLGNGKRVRQKRQVKKGLSASGIATHLAYRTGGWPKRVGDELFVPGDGGAPLWLGSPAELFAWAQGRLPGDRGNQVSWAKGSDKVSQEVFHAYLRQHAEEYLAVETAPHEPPVPGYYYMHPPLKGGDGQALAALIDRFNPATEVDKQLIKAYFLTLLWGGPCGLRPAFVIDVDAPVGCGAGKTMLATAGARVLGSTPFSVLPGGRGDMDRVVTRLLSPEARGKRLVLMDNLKEDKLSWDAMESLITSPVISGHSMYRGEGTRPNRLIWVLTFNGASLSRDSAQRCVVIRIKPVVEYTPTWYRETFGLIDAQRDEILGDIVAELRRPARELKKYTRRSDWEEAVLSRCDDPDECVKVSLERAAEADADREESAVVRLALMEQIRRHKKDPDSSVVFFGCTCLSKVVEEATHTPVGPTKVTGYLKKQGIAEMRHDHRADANSWVWTGSKADAQQAEVVIREYRGHLYS
jgi:hypothetical protein